MDSLIDKKVAGEIRVQRHKQHKLLDETMSYLIRIYGLEAVSSIVYAHKQMVDEWKRDRRESRKERRRKQ